MILAFFACFCNSAWLLLYCVFARENRHFVAFVLLSARNQHCHKNVITFSLARRNFCLTDGIDSAWLRPIVGTAFFALASVIGLILLPFRIVVKKIVDRHDAVVKRRSSLRRI